MKRTSRLTTHLRRSTVNSQIREWPDREAGLRKGAKHEKLEASEVRNETEGSLKTAIYVQGKADYH